MAMRSLNCCMVIAVPPYSISRTYFSYKLSCLSHFSQRSFSLIPFWIGFYFYSISDELSSVWIVDFIIEVITHVIIGRPTDEGNAQIHLATLAMPFQSSGE